LSEEWPLVEADAHCWMWTTNTFLPQGIELMRQCGFRYITNTVWVKVRLPDSGQPVFTYADLQVGLGQYQRGAHELLLFGARGRAMLPGTRDRLPSVVFAPRVRKDGKDRHSAKPLVFYDRIEAVSPGPYLEMFARSERPGWTSWGNEVHS
jgi:N6-adenosine-specific RNA methylase IME4